MQKNLRIAVLVLGVALISVGAIVMKSLSTSEPQVEVLDSTSESDTKEKLIVEISGSVEKSGVYTLPVGSRVEDALIAAGGISANADRDLIAKIINRAAKLTDGQKIYIPEQSSALSAKSNGGIKVDQGTLGVSITNLVNINTASLGELDTLQGIGLVYAQRIIDQRPYSSVEELLSKKILSKSVYEKIKEKITVY
ncbi:hypothetical protein A3D00_03060 [Candidatus Woesebacteria bacterium RIFCSPHIGHO2_02_FULL_38_9]|uniref:Soluble ligand binding domain-containing protein n=1 Tax=Candidatus Woesebacteria bacterium RIFCSPHIGHO2_01_FULL_39_28 TaxID=1802496 RepID=A0A1F7YET2_9BACT|nr:MAG: hypothetical protein A2627_02790 [Candidatus Woesebacteria bacterium RIFCSPHIGHO2_01_FULL_39_28]OGM34665.1 MAG: hypothetical protein A3D00_03060 [Candidatus Woesebacteria bacterium RIFCSPHIGHO2_02_FULL_38_9]OGM58593.1 MAG: hypothetical protein A3A50_00930 [Candidatus Woesebacteria bacterium RIFCSPLOWO2_01_FULL_38_20]